MFGVDRDRSFYCAFMSMLFAAGENKLVFLSIFSSVKNQCQYVRWQNDVCALSMQLSCPQIPFTVACLLQTKLPKMMEKRGYIFGMERAAINTALCWKKQCPSIWHLYSFNFCPLAFFPFIFSISFSVTTSECPDSPSLPNSVSSRLDLSFLVSFCQY